MLNTDRFVLIRIQAHASTLDIRQDWGTLHRRIIDLSVLKFQLYDINAANLKIQSASDL
jgi:hypothetical protein